MLARTCLPPTCSPLGLLLKCAIPLLPGTEPPASLWGAGQGAQCWLGGGGRETWSHWASGQGDAAVYKNLTAPLSIPAACCTPFPSVLLNRA